MPSLEEGFRILRVTVEGRLTLPAMIVVSAALSHEGTTYVAQGLARAFAEAGRRTLLLDTSGGDRSSPHRRIDGAGANLVLAAFDAHERARIVAELRAEGRAQYAAIVVDAPPIPESGLALELAETADGVLLAVRLGRRPEAADIELRRLLGEISTRVLGVVPTHARKRRDFAPHAPSPVAAVTDLIPRRAAKARP
jgi:Mrp family chromosome partitioning ATPase